MARERVVVVRRNLDLAVLAADGAGGRLVLDLAELADADLGTVDALSRLHLAVTRAGGRLRLRNTPVRLAELLELAGLSRVLVG